MAWGVVGCCGVLRLEWGAVCCGRCCVVGGVEVVVVVGVDGVVGVAVVVVVVDVVGKVLSPVPGHVVFLSTSLWVNCIPIQEKTEVPLE